MQFRADGEEGSQEQGVQRMVRKTAKYKVTLTDEERTELEVLISAGKSAARKLFRARGFC